MGLLDAIPGINPGLLSGIRSLGALSGFDEGTVLENRLGLEKVEQLEKDRELETQRQNQTSAYLRKMGKDELANAVDMGLMTGQDAFGKYYSEVHAPKADNLKTVGGHLYDANTGGWISPPQTDNRQNISLNGQWGTDAQGKPVFLQPSSTGEMIPAQVPDGVTLMSPGELAGSKTGATVDAKTAGAARSALRGAEVSMSNTGKAIAELRNNAAGMKEWFGQIGPRGTYIHPGSEMGKFWAAAEPTNNQGFMQAREMLKGGGQITDYEGRKAEDAFSRMRASLETGDQEQYLRAVADFEAAVAEGYSKLQQAAQGGYSAGSPFVGGEAPNVDDILTKYGL